jgi:hypothetical protein
MLDTIATKDKTPVQLHHAVMQDLLPWQTAAIIGGAAAPSSKNGKIKIEIIKPFIPYQIIFPKKFFTDFVKIVGLGRGLGPALNKQLQEATKQLRNLDGFPD